MRSLLEDPLLAAAPLGMRRPFLGGAYGLQTLRGDRIEAPLVREADRHVAVDWDVALDALGRLVRGAGSTVILASGRASVESRSSARPSTFAAHFPGVSP